MVFIDYQLDRRLSRTMIGFLDSKDLNSPSHFLISRQDQLRLIFQWWVWAPTNQAYYSHLRQPTYLKLLPLEKEGHRAYQAEIQGGTSEATEGKAQKHCNLILPCRNKVFRLFLLLTWRAENRKWFHKWRNEKPCLVCVSCECAWCPGRSEGNIGSLETGVTDGCGPPCRCWEASPLQQNHQLKAPLQPPWKYFSFL